VLQIFKACSALAEVIVDTVTVYYACRWVLEPLQELAATVTSRYINVHISLAKPAATLNQPALTSHSNGLLIDERGQR